MNIQEELHRLIDTLNVNDTKQRLHVLVAELDEETVRKIMLQVEKLRRRRRLEPWGFRIG